MDKGRPAELRTGPGAGGEERLEDIIKRSKTSPMKEGPESSKKQTRKEEISEGVGREGTSRASFHRLRPSLKQEFGESFDYEIELKACDFKEQLSDRIKGKGAFRREDDTQEGDIHNLRILDSFGAKLSQRRQQASAENNLTSLEKKFSVKAGDEWLGKGSNETAADGRGQVPLGSQVLFQKKQPNVFKESQKSSQNKDNFCSLDQNKFPQFEAVENPSINAHVFETLSREVKPPKSSAPKQRPSLASHGSLSRPERLRRGDSVEGVDSKFENYFSNRNRKSKKTKAHANLHRSDPPDPRSEYSVQPEADKRREQAKRSRGSLQRNESQKRLNSSVQRTPSRMASLSKNESNRHSHKGGRSPREKSGSRLTGFHQLSNGRLTEESEYYDFSRQLNDISRLTSPFDVIIENEPAKSVFDENVKLSKIAHQREAGEARAGRRAQKGMSRESRQRLFRQTLDILNLLREDLPERPSPEVEGLRECRQGADEELAEEKRGSEGQLRRLREALEQRDRRIAEMAQDAKILDLENQQLKIELRKNDLEKRQLRKEISELREKLRTKMKKKVRKKGKFDIIRENNPIGKYFHIHKDKFQ